MSRLRIAPGAAARLISGANKELLCHPPTRHRRCILTPTSFLRSFSSSTTPPQEAFGHNPGGPSISNKDTILQDVDRALGVNKPPDLEVFLTEHVCNVASAASRFVHLHLIRFGHVGIRYRTSDGKDRVMNINGDFTPRHRNAHMVNFIPPHEFVFGTDGEMAQQGGVYNRPYVSVRVENVAPGTTDALHAYYEALHKASCIQPVRKARDDNDDGSSNNGNQGSARFNLVDVNLSVLARHLPPPLAKVPLKVISFFQRQHEQVQKTRDNNNDSTKNNASTSGGSGSLIDSLSSSMASTDTSIKQIGQNVQNAVNDVENVYHDVRDATFVAGNCAQWTSKGLAFCGLLRRPRLFPKAILVELLEDEFFSGRTDNVNVVVYQQVEHASKKTDWGGPYEYIRSAFVHPLRISRNLWYEKPEEFSSAIVSVPKGTTQAIVTVQTPSKRPAHFLRVLSVTSAVVPAGIMFGLVDQIGPIGPVSAAVWLAINYWLY